MHERDLRRQALESGKTLSRKAKARQMSARSSQAGSAPNSATNSPAHSPTHSPAASRGASRNPSRHGSDVEDNDEDDLEAGIAMLDIGRFGDFENAAPGVWRQELSECTVQIVERSRNKRNTAEAREEMLAIYTNILSSQYAADEVEPKLDELIPALVKCFKSGSSEREAVFALKALCVTVVSTMDEIYEEVSQPLRNRIQDSSSAHVQATAIHALGTAAFFSGADFQETQDVMEFFLEIIQSDGHSVEAPDSGVVVTAALQEWGLLATRFQDFEGRSTEPIEVFENQLESSSLSVQVAAGENIALLYEQSFSPAGDDEESDADESDEDEYEFGAFRRTNWIKRYDAYTESEYSLKSKLAELSRSSARYLGKEKRKDLHKTFTDVSHSVDHPWRGPRFSTALNEEMTSYMGHRLIIKFGQTGRLMIDRWWKFHRYEAIKRILGGGFAAHYRVNERIMSALPASLEAPAEF